ncbi:MAG: c-type cytochrome [Campylobacterota bacterium]|nr:c-type cytochrome [Campylobacterota bacterium]
MRSTLFLLALLSVSLSAADGYEVYKNKCQQCHIEMISKAETLKIFKTLKAPPMVEVSNRIKENIIIADDDDDVKRRVVIAFIKDYIENPSLDYSMCHAMAIERFDIMPSQKGKLTQEEIEAVAIWVHDRYEDTEFK